MGSPRLEDSRRLTGPNLLGPLPGAVIDVTLGDHPPEPVMAAWRAHARKLLDAVGWEGEQLAGRHFDGGASLAISAPVDALYAATEVNEGAWEAAVAELAGESAPPLGEVAARLRDAIAAERNPRLLALRDAALARGVTFLSDDETASVGTGRGSSMWPVSALPDPSEVAWSEVHDVPVALITGCNGKTTTVRLLAAVARAAGRTPGYTSTDGIYVGQTLQEGGDYSGPEGARTVLRDRRVDCAILETARGGILRRGLPVTRAAVALVTNVAADHLGEFGVTDLDAIAEAKLVVHRAVADGGALAVNADDHVLAAHARRCAGRVVWFGMDRRAPHLGQHVALGGAACLVEGDAFVVMEHGVGRPVLAVDEAPITMGGAARHNVYNVLGVLAVGSRMGFADGACREALKAFGSAPDENPGRGNLFTFGGLRVLVDFAHNPHGVAALVEMVGAIPAARRLVILGQAGDRDDEAIRALARAAWQLRPDRLVIKEMRKYLRGREPGVIPGILEDELRRCGAPAEAVTRADSEMDAVRDALRWAREGDFLVVTTHDSRQDVLDLMRRLTDARWRPGRELPAVSDP